MIAVNYSYSIHLKTLCGYFSQIISQFCSIHLSLSLIIRTVWPGLCPLQYQIINCCIAYAASDGQGGFSRERLPGCLIPPVSILIKGVKKSPCNVDDGVLEEI